MEPGGGGGEGGTASLKVATHFSGLSASQFSLTVPYF